MKLFSSHPDFCMDLAFLREYFFGGRGVASDVFQGEHGGTPSLHLSYQGNGVPPAKIKHGGTAFPLTGIKLFKYEWSSVNAVRHRPNNFGYHLYYIRVIFGNIKLLRILGRNTSERNFVTILISLKVDILAENSSRLAQKYCLSQSLIIHKNHVRLDKYLYCHKRGKRQDIISSSFAQSRN